MLKVAIVEDDDDIMRLLTDYLLRKGHEVLNAYSNATLNLFQNERPDLYMIDYKLAGSDKNGIEVAIDILKHTPQMPVLFITAYEHIDREILNNTDFRNKKIAILIKPFKLSQIDKSVLELTGKKTNYNSIN